MAGNVSGVPVEERRQIGIGHGLSSLQSIKDNDMKAGTADSAKWKEVKYTKEKKKEKTPSEENYKERGTKVSKTKANYDTHQAKKNRPISTSENSDNNKSHTGEKREHKQIQYCLTVTEESYKQRGTKVCKTKANYKPYQVQKNHSVNTPSNSDTNRKHSGQDQKHEQTESTSTSNEENYKQRGIKVSKSKASYKPYQVKKNHLVNTPANSDTNKSQSQGESERKQTQSPSTLTGGYYKEGTKDCKTKTSHELCQVKSNHSVNTSSSSGISKSQSEGERGYKQNQSPSQKRTNNSWRYDQHKSNEKYDEKNYEQKNKANYEQKKQSHKQNNYRSFANKQKQKQSRHKKTGNENVVPSNDHISNKKKVIHKTGKGSGLHDMTNTNSRRYVKEQTSNMYVSKDDSNVSKDGTNYNDTELDGVSENSTITLNNEDIKIGYENEVELPFSLSNKESEIIYTEEVEKDKSSAKIMLQIGDINLDTDHGGVNDHNNQLYNIVLPFEVDNVGKVGFSASLENNEPETIIFLNEAENESSSVEIMLQNGDTDQDTEHGNKSEQNTQLHIIESPSKINNEDRVGLSLSLQNSEPEILYRKEDERKSSVKIVLQNGDADEDIDHANTNGENTQLHNTVSPAKKSVTQKINNLSIAEINIIKQIDNKRRVQGIGILECPCSLSLNGERVGYCDAHELIFQF